MVKILLHIVVKKEKIKTLQCKRQLFCEEKRNKVHFPFNNLAFNMEKQFTQPRFCNLEFTLFFVESFYFND